MLLNAMSEAKGTRAAIAQATAFLRAALGTDTAGRHSACSSDFAEHELETDRGVIFARVGGSGPPLLLLHGYPQTHLMWHAAAPLLAERFTVVAADLPGYGASFRPAPAPDHAPHAKRALAATWSQAMAALGHERFAVAGHDRGGRVAYRMALDHPDRGRARSRCSTSCRPARCGRAPTRSSRSSTGTGRSSPSRRRCPSA